MATGEATSRRPPPPYRGSGKPVRSDRANSTLGLLPSRHPVWRSDRYFVMPARLSTAAGTPTDRHALYPIRFCLAYSRATATKSASA